MVLVVPVLIGLAWASFRWFDRLPWLLAFSLALPISAVVRVGGQVVGAFQLFALAAIPTAAWLWARRPQERPLGWPGSTLLVLFVAWAVFVTIAAPTLFDGISVLSPRGGIDSQVVDPSRLTYSISNVAQTFYLFSGAVIICLIAGRRRLSPHLLTPGLAGAMLISNWRLGFDKLGLPYPVSVIDTAAFRYIDVTATGDYRLRGVFSEPAGLALYALAALALSISMVPRTRGWTRWGYLAIIGSAVLNLAFSASGTALIGGLLVAALAGAVAYGRLLRDQTSAMPLAITSCAAVTLFLCFYQPITTFVSGQVSSKVDSTSYAARTASDVFSLKLSAETYGFGVGLGSNKPSSMWPLVLSCTGVVGALAFAALVLFLMRAAFRYPPARPFFWVFATMIATKSVVGGNITDPLLQLCLGLGAWASYQALRGREEAPAPPTEPSTISSRPPAAVAASGPAAPQPT